MRIGMKVYPQLRQLFAGQVQDRVAFLHLPKCGGVAIDEALRNSFGIREIIRQKNLVHLDPFCSAKAAEILEEDVIDFRETLLLYYLANPQCRYISGHFAYSESAVEQFGKEWNFITILRHPVSRWLSHYFFNRFKADNHFRIESDLENFIESERGIALGTEYVRKLTGNLSSQEATSEKAINQAIQNLKNFALVGALENLDCFVEDYQERFGAKLFIQQRNTNPLSKSRQDAQITEEAKKKVEVICQPDLRVYEAVLKN